MKALYKTTIVIWSDRDVSDMDAEDLGRDSISGESYCSRMKTTVVDNPKNDPDFADPNGDPEGFFQLN
jgi:hypothetical protein